MSQSLMPQRRGFSNLIRPRMKRIKLAEVCAKNRALSMVATNTITIEHSTVSRARVRIMVAATLLAVIQKAIIQLAATN